jgi:hypothetical protein
MIDPSRRAFLKALVAIPAASVAVLTVRNVRSSGLSTADLEAAFLDYLGVPTPCSVGLFTSDGEVSGNGYSRAQLHADSADGGEINGQCEFSEATGDWGLVKGYRIYNNATGEMLAEGTFETAAESFGQHIHVGDSAMLHDLRISLE